jgi:hypothetical protein
MRTGEWHQNHAREVIVPFLLDAWKMRNAEWFEYRGILDVVRSIWHELRGF